MLILSWLVWPGLLGLQAAPYRVHRETAQTSPYRVDRWTTEHGLPQNTVNALFQSRDGYLWIGTRHGLARYDGVRFKDFSERLVEDDESDLDIRGIAEDSAGALWCRTPRGLMRYHRGEIRKFPNRIALGDVEVKEMCAHPEGGLWVAANDALFRFDGTTLQRFCALPTGADEWVSQLRMDSQSNLWVRISGSLPLNWLHVDVRVGVVAPLEVRVPGANQVDALWPGRGNELWLGQPHELMHWDGERLDRYSASEAWGNSPVRSLLEDSKGMVWATSYQSRKQLHMFVGGTFRSFGIEQGLFDTADVRCELADQEGNIWIGTGSGGLYRLQQRRLVSLLSGYNSDLDEVYSVTKGSGETVWLATAYGLVKVEGITHTIYTNNSTFPVGNFCRVRPVLEHSSGTVYVGLDFEGLAQLKDGDLELVPTPRLSEGGRRVVNSLCEAPDGALWVAAERGLLRYHGGQSEFWDNQGRFSNGQLFGLACGPDGTVWVGTRTHGLWRLRDGHFTQYTTREGLLSQNVWPLRVEADHTLWAATPKGLHRVRSQAVHCVTPRQGLPPPPYYALIPDAKGNYWCYGNRGIWRVRSSELHAAAENPGSGVFCVSYGEDDGMKSAEGNGDQQPNAADLGNGELWFPMTRGVVIVNPDELADNRVRPPVVIEEVLVDGRVAFADGGYPGKSPPKVESGLLLQPGSARELEVRFTANTFVDPEKTRFRYRLLGAGEEWVTDRGRRAFYTNLRPGSYRFEVEACNHHGYWSERPAAFRFVLPPRFHETWWFYTLAGLAAGGLFGTWHWQRLRNTRKLQSLEQDQALQQERARIAKDLHDDLGANLTGIALQLEVARAQARAPKPVDQRLRESITDVREMVERMRDVVWSLNPECDTLESFGNYLSQYAEERAETAQLRCRILMPDELPQLSLSAETRHHLLLAVKEALTNAAKHAQATEIRFGLRHSENSLTITVGDNGCGFDPGSLQTATGFGGGRARGMGLRNIESRVAALRGALRVETEPGKGTLLTITIPLLR